MPEKFDPTKFKSYEELPEEQKPQFKPVEGGFVDKTAVESLEEARKEATEIHELADENSTAEKYFEAKEEATKYADGTTVHEKREKRELPMEEIEKKIEELQGKGQLDGKTYAIKNSIERFPSKMQDIIKSIEHKNTGILSEEQINKKIEEDKFSRFEKIRNFNPSLFYYDIDPLFAKSTIRREGLDDPKMDTKAILNEISGDIIKNEGKTAREKLIKFASKGLNIYIKEIINKEIDSLERLERQRKKALDYLKNQNKETFEKMRGDIADDNGEFFQDYTGHLNTIWGGNLVFDMSDEYQKFQRKQEQSPLEHYISLKVSAAFVVKTKYSMLLMEHIFNKWHGNNYEIEDFKYCAPRLIAAIETIIDGYYEYFMSKEKKQESKEG